MGPGRKLMFRSISEEGTPSICTTSYTKNKWICNLLFFASSVDSLKLLRRNVTMVVSGVETVSVVIEVNTVYSSAVETPVYSHLH